MDNVLLWFVIYSVMGRNAQDVSLVSNSNHILLMLQEFNLIHRFTVMRFVPHHVLARVKARPLEAFGPQLERPYADTLNGSKHANMKELRFDAAGGVWPSPPTHSGKRQPCYWRRGDHDIARTPDAMIRGLPLD